MKRYEWYREIMRNGADRSVVFDILRDWEQESILMDRLYKMIILINLDIKNQGEESTLEEFAFSQIKNIIEEIKQYNNWKNP